MSAWDDFKNSNPYKGDIEITDHLTNYDSVNTWSGIEATAAFPLADPNDIAAPSSSSTPATTVATSTYTFSAASTS